MKTLNWLSKDVLTHTSHFRFVCWNLKHVSRNADVCGLNKLQVVTTRSTGLHATDETHTQASLRPANSSMLSGLTDRAESRCVHTVWGLETSSGISCRVTASVKQLGGNYLPHAAAVWPGQFSNSYNFFWNSKDAVCRRHDKFPNAGNASSICMATLLQPCPMIQKPIHIYDYYNHDNIQLT
jgi:hypothetical protein